MSAQDLAWLTGDGQDLSITGSEAFSTPSYGDAEPAQRPAGRLLFSERQLGHAGHDVIGSRLKSSCMSVTMPCLEDDATARRLLLEPSQYYERVVCLQVLGGRSWMLSRTRKDPWTRCGSATLWHDFSRFSPSRASSRCAMDRVPCFLSRLWLPISTAAQFAAESTITARAVQAQVLAWLMGDGREASMAGSEAVSMPSYGNEDPGGDAAHGSAVGGDEERTHPFPGASRANW